MISNLHKLTLYLLLLTALFFFYGCPGGNPKITLEVTDCPKDQITITDQTTVRSISGEQWQLTTTITVKCNGQPANKADIKLEFWWPNGTFKKQTNDKGEVRFTKKGQGSKPSGQTFTVTIVGNDGEMTKDFTVP
jgi:hypothetical protein